MRSLPRLLVLCSFSLAAACTPARSHAPSGATTGSPTPLVIVAPTEPREQTADQQVRHVLDRLGFGPRPGDVTRVREMGVDRWIALQLAPDRIPNAATDSLITSAFETYHADTRELVEIAQSGQQAIRQRARQAAQQGDTAGKRDTAAQQLLGKIGIDCPKIRRCRNQPLRRTIGKT